MQKNVALCIPSGGMWLAQSAMSIIGVMMATSTAAVRPWITQGCYVSGNREALAAEALADGATHVLCMDVDMEYPARLVDALLAHDKPIVGLNYMQRSINPAKPVAVDAEGDVWTMPDSTGLQEVLHTGTGGLLISRECLEAIPRPWFRLDWTEERQREIGEDVYFCRKAKEHGFSTLIDHDLSKDVLHYGHVPFRFQMVWAQGE